MPPLIQHSTRISDKYPKADYRTLYIKLTFADIQLSWFYCLWVFFLYASVRLQIHLLSHSEAVSAFFYILLYQLMTNFTTLHGGIVVLKPSDITSKLLNSQDATTFLFPKSLCDRLQQTFQNRSSSVFGRSALIMLPKVLSHTATFTHACSVQIQPSGLLMDVISTRAVSI